MAWAHPAWAGAACPFHSPCCPPGCGPLVSREAAARRGKARSLRSRCHLPGPPPPAPGAAPLCRWPGPLAPPQRGLQAAAASHFWDQLPPQRPAKGDGGPSSFMSRAGLTSRGAGRMRRSAPLWGREHRVQEGSARGQSWEGLGGRRPGPRPGPSACPSCRPCPPSAGDGGSCALRPQRVTTRGSRGCVSQGDPMATTQVCTVPKGQAPMGEQGSGPDRPHSVSL